MAGTRGRQGGGGGGRGGEGRRSRLSLRAAPDNRAAPRGGAVAAPTRRQAAHADVARRRAAHFANFNEQGQQESDEEEEEDDEGDEDEDDDDEENDDDNDDSDEDSDEEDDVHVGGDSARELGMWSTMRQIGRGSHRAAKKRKKDGDEPAVVASVKKLQKEEEQIDWRPKRPLKPSRKLIRPVPSLVSTILEWVADRAEDVETLEGLPDSVRMQLSLMLTKRRRINNATVHLLTSGAASEVEIGNCAELDEEQLGHALSKCELNKMEALRLHFCGRGLTRQTVERLLYRDIQDETASSKKRANTVELSKQSRNKLPLLKEMLLRGAYRLSDEGLNILLGAVPNVENLSLIACSRLSPSGISEIPTKLKHLKMLDLHKCQQLDSFNIVATVSELQWLQRLRIADLPQLSDEALCDMVSNVGQRLIELDISLNPHLTKTSLNAIGICCPKMKILKMERLPALNVELIQAAPDGKSSKKSKKKSKKEDPSESILRSNVENILEPLVSGCKELRELYLEELDIPDSHLASLLSNGSMYTTLSLRRLSYAGNETAMSIANNLGESLVELDISFSRKMNSSALGLIADNCHRLKKLSVWGSTQLTNRFFDGHSNDDLEIVGSHEHRY